MRHRRLLYMSGGDRSTDKTVRKELLNGTLDLLILKTLDIRGALHGYAIARRIEQMSASVMRLSQGSIYPALIRLEQNGWITTKWGQSQGQVLFADPGGHEAAARGGRQLGTSDRSGRTGVGSQGVTPRRLAQRLLALVRQNRLERELDDEVQAHLDLAERDALARGLPPAEARDEARRAFGGVQQMKERHRDDRSARSIENLARDIRYGVAALRRDPAFTLVAVSVMALGIGANTAMFSLVDGILFPPLPFPNPERIVRVWEAPTPSTSNATTTSTFEELKRQS